jgi:glycosyltransferase involved in cell wall biosynthesis
MRLCLVNPEFTPFRGSGQAVHAEKVARGAAAHHSVTVVTAARAGAPAAEILKGVRVIRVPVCPRDPSGWISFARRCAPVVEGLLRRGEVEMAHVLDLHVGCFLRVPFVATLHQSFRQRLTGDRGLPYHSSLANLLQRTPYYLAARVLEERAARRASAFLSVSASTLDEFVRHYRVDRARARVVPNGIDTALFRRRDASALRERLGLADRKVLLHVGFSTPRKGLEFLADALRLLERDDLRLLLVGRWEKGYRERFFRRLGPRASVLVETGYVPDAEMPLYYSAADLLVLPSLLEGFGFPIAEALACGIPVVATRVGSIPEVAGPHARLVPPADGAALAAAIAAALADEGERERIGVDGPDWVERNFSERAMVEGTLGFYRETARLVASGGSC